MKKRVLFPVLGLFTAVLSAQEVNFTVEEGYVKPALYANENWSGTYAFPTWQINKENGTVATKKRYHKEVWNNPVKLKNTGDSATFRVDFNFVGTLNEENATLLSVGFNSEAEYNKGVNNIVIINTRKEGSLQVRDNGNTGILSPNIFKPIASVQGAKLAIEVTVILGEKASSTEIAAKLINITDGTESKIGSYKGVEKALFKAVKKKGVYPMFNSLDFTTKQNITEIVVDKVSLK